MPDTTHAPTPWKIEYSTTGSGQVIGMTDANGRDIRASAIGSTTAAEGSRTSEMIFRAVNAHDDLVEAVRDLAMAAGYGQAVDRARALLAALDAEVALTKAEA